MYVFVCALCVVASFASPSLGERIQSRITAREFDSYVSRLQLSDDAAAVARTMYESYLVRWSSDLSPRLQEHHRNEQSAIEWVNQEGENAGRRARHAYTQLLRERDELKSLADRLDSALFDELARLLPAGAVQHMERVRTTRLRTNLAWNLQHELPEARVDLIALVESMGLPSDLKHHVDQAVLRDFEAPMIDAWKRSARADQRHSIEYWEIEAILHEMRVAPPHEAGEAEVLRRVDQLRDDAGRARVNAADAAAHLVEGALTQVVLLLPEPHASSLIRQFRVLAFPSVLPDDGDAASLFEAAVSNSELPIDIRPAVELARDEFQREHAILTEEMIEVVSRRARTAMRQAPGVGHDLLDLDLEIIRLGEAREALNQRQHVLLMRLLPPDLVSALPIRDFEANAPKRPWDPR